MDGSLIVRIAAGIANMVPLSVATTTSCASLYFGSAMSGVTVEDSSAHESADHEVAELEAETGIPETTSTTRARSKACDILDIFCV